MLGLFGEKKKSKQATAAESSLGSLYPAWTLVDQREAGMVDLPASASAYFSCGTGGGTISQRDVPFGIATGNNAVKITHTLPIDRAARYAVLKAMMADPTIQGAVQMHLANALSARSDTGESVFIESVDGKPNAMVDELRAALMPTILKDLNEWGRKAAVYGSCFVRVYGKPGVGIQNVRCDYYTRPQFVKKFEKAGRLAGFTTTHQGVRNTNHRLQLMPPWSMVGFEIPEWTDADELEPVSSGVIPVDLSLDDFEVEGLVESQEYGNSLIATAYGPWMDLLEAICSLRMSRKNAARLERIIGVSMGKLEPERAAHYLDMIAENITNSSNEVQKQSWLNGDVQTVLNHYIPIFGDKGALQVDAVQGTPDINGLEDVMFHVKRLGSAIGIDPALLGFGDLLSGGLGDGGFFRLSVMAGTKANLLRKALTNGIQRLCEIHIAYKYGKVFMFDDCPWKITFNSVSSSIEREAQETLEARANVVGGLVGSFATIDQDFTVTDKREFCHVLWKLLQFDDDSFNKVFPEGKQTEAPPENAETIE